MNKSIIYYRSSSFYATIKLSPRVGSLGTSWYIIQVDQFLSSFVETSYVENLNPETKTVFSILIWIKPFSAPYLSSMPRPFTVFPSEHDSASWQR